MKVTAVYKTLTIESAITTEDIKVLESEGAFNALDLIEEDEVVFSVGISVAGQVSPSRLTFDSNTSTGNLYVTILDKNIPNTPEEKREYLKSYNRIFSKLQKVETQVKQRVAMPSDVADIEVNII